MKKTKNWLIVLLITLICGVLVWIATYNQAIALTMFFVICLMVCGWNYIIYLLKKWTDLR